MGDSVSKLCVKAVLSTFNRPYYPSYFSQNESIETVSSEQGVGGSSPSAGTNFMPVIFIILGILTIILSFTAFFGAPYVPSLKSELKKAFTKLYPLSEKDTLIDLGAGDGVVLKVASEFKAKGIGIELNPVFALISKFRLRKTFITTNFRKKLLPFTSSATLVILKKSRGRLKEKRSV